MRRPILIVEYFCSGGGGERVDRSVPSEARLILEAVAADFAALPGVRVLTLVRAGVRLDLPSEHEVRIVPGCGGFARAFGKALAEVEAALVIAPERHGILLRLTRAIERAGVASLGCDAGAVRVASDKWLTYAALRRAGVPQPRTVRIPARGRVPEEALPGWARGDRARRGPGWIVKPRDGYACLGVGAVDARTAAGRRRGIDMARRLARRHTRRPHLLLQERARGIDASVSLIGDGRCASPVCLNLQRLRWGERLEYRGGRAGLDHPLRERALEAAARAAWAIPGLRGYFGVDLVLGEDGVSVIEVNPRLTTSYIGLRRVAPVNPAAWIVDAARRRRGPRRVRLKGSAEFSVQCPTSAAGTSAASI
jgi:hypothetical protein